MNAIDAPADIREKVQKLWEAGVLLAQRVHRFQSDAVPDGLHAQLWGTCTVINHLLTMPERDEKLPIGPYFVPHVNQHAIQELRDNMLEVARLMPVRIRRLSPEGWVQFWGLVVHTQQHTTWKAAEQAQVLARDFGDILTDPQEWQDAAKLYVAHKVPTGVRMLSLT